MLPTQHAQHERDRQQRLKLKRKRKPEPSAAPKRKTEPVGTPKLKRLVKKGALEQAPPAGGISSNELEDLPLAKRVCRDAAGVSRQAQPYLVYSTCLTCLKECKGMAIYVA